MAYPGMLTDFTADAALASPALYDLNHPVWMNEVLTAEFSQLWVARTVMNKSVDFASGNREADFVVTGRLGTSKYNRGDEKRGMDRKQIKRTLTLNDRPDYTAIEDEKLTRMFEQVNTRGPLTEAMGHALAARTEVEVMRRITIAARHANTSDTPDEFREGGNYYVGAKDGTGLQYDFSYNQTGAKNLQKAIKEASIASSKLNSKGGIRYCYIPTELFYEFRELETVYPASTNTIAGGIYGNLDIAGQSMPVAQGVDMNTPLVYYNTLIFPHNLVTADYDDEIHALKRDWSGDPDAAGNFSNTIGAIYQSECVGHVDVMATAFKVEEIPRTDIELVSAMAWTGGGTLKPEVAFELVTT